MNYLLAIIVAVTVLGAGWYALDKNDETVPNVAPAGRGQQQQLREHAPVDVDYVVDEADYVDAPELLKDLGTGELTTAEAGGLLYMREEEKLARDVYQTLYEKWGVQIFSNIAASEQTHMDSMLTLVERYGLSDPVLEGKGSFANTELQAFYNSLVAEGSQSLADAYRVGALIEDLDIYDLEQNIAAADQPDIQLVYENLQRGSRNHLRAFNKQLERATGESYVPEYISVTEFESIIGSDTERGPRGGRRLE